MSFADHFSAVSADYANFRPAYPDALFAYLAETAPALDLAWDCATGSGQAAAGLATHFKQVHATDASAAQIASATPHLHVDYAVAPAEASGLEDASCDLITVAQALHWFDLPRFLDEARRVLRPSGVLAVWCYGPHRLDTPGLDAINRHFYEHIIGPYWPPERALVASAYRTLEFPGFDELPPPTFELSHDWPLDALLGYMGTWSATQGYRRVTGEDPMPAMRARLLPEWGGLTQPRPVRWPLALRVFRRP